MPKLLEETLSGERSEADVLPPQIVALIRERWRRLAAIPRFDRYIAEAAGHGGLQGFWLHFRRQNLEDARRLKQRIDREIADADRPPTRRRGPDDRGMTGDGPGP